MSVLSEEYTEARRWLGLAGQRKFSTEERLVMAVTGLAHAVLATAAPGIAAESQQERDRQGEQP